MSHSNESNIRHQQVWELLPWFVNGTASNEECRLVETHLKSCEGCREELTFQRRMFAGMQTDTRMTPDPAPGLERLWQKIDRVAEQETAAGHKAPTAAPRRRMALFMYGLAAMVVLQTGGLAMLGAQFFAQHPAGDIPAGYRTLSSPEANVPRATIRIVPATAMSVGELGGLLQQLQLQIVAGPTEAGVYSLASTAGQHDTASQLARLRAVSGMRFAEPIGIPVGAP